MTDTVHELQELADFAAMLDFNQLPADVVDRVHWIVRDTVGVIVGGMREPDVRALADWATNTNAGEVTLYGHGGRVKPGWAAFVHAAAGNTLEMDEGHAYAMGHAAIHAVPTALALGAAAGAGGPETIAAIVAGYEVAARVGVATTLRRVVHPFGAWGVLGAAVIGGRFHGYDGKQMLGVMNLAASYAINPSFDAALQGANGRNTYAGLVNQNGLLAADLYALGFRGERAGVMTTFGQILGERFHPAALVDGLGERYELMRGYFKPYSACRYTHAAVDAALALRREYGMDTRKIERVVVETYDFASRLADPRPRTALAGRFSIPYVVAAVLSTGSAGPEIFGPEMLNDPGLLALAERVQVVEDPVLTAMTPSHRPARMRIQLRDGASLETLVTLTRGDPDLPMTREELRTKFASLVTPVLGQPRSDTLWEILGNLAELTDIRMLEPLLEPM